MQSVEKPMDNLEFRIYNFPFEKIPFDIYLSAPSGISVTTRFPAPNFDATCTAAATFAPDDDPPRIPSSAVRRRTMAKASLSGMVMISFASERSSTGGKIG